MKYGGDHTNEDVNDKDVSDERLLAAHRAGDSRAFPRLVARHTEQLLKVALRTTGSEADAEDAIQEAFLKVHRKSSSLRKDASVGTWLHRITLNSLYDNHRKQGKMLQEPVEHSRIPLLTAQNDYVDGQEFGVAGDQVVRLVVQEALAKLPEFQRETIRMVDLQGHTTEETAEDLGISVGTVKSRRSRGRREMRRILATAPAPRRRECTPR